MLKKIVTWIMKKKKVRSFRKNAVIGEGFQADVHSLCSNWTGRQDAIRIGSNCCIRGRLLARGDGNIRIGENCYLGGNSALIATESIVLGNQVMISGDTNIYDNNSHPVEPELREEMCRSGDFFGPLWSCTRAVSAPVQIDDNVWVGERCIILKGVHIGTGSVIGAGSVVTRDVPPYTVAAGNPARVVKTLKGKKRTDQ